MVILKGIKEVIKREEIEESVEIKPIWETRSKWILEERISGGTHWPYAVVDIYQYQRDTKEIAEQELVKIQDEREKQGWRRTIGAGGQPDPHHLTRNIGNMRCDIEYKIYEAQISG